MTTDDFHKFLDQHRVEKGADFTHTGLGFPKGSFFVPSNRQAEFLQLYTRAAACGHVFITEKHKEVGPLVVDLDFKFNGCDESRRYTDEHIRKIARAYTRSIASLLQVGASVRAVVLEKPSPVPYNGGIKDGLHLVFPYVVTPAPEQYMIRAEMLKRLPSDIEDLRPYNAWSDVIDDAVISRNNWMMYGSRKPNCEPYRVTKVLDVCRDTLDVTDVTDTLPDASDMDYWVPLLSIRDKFDYIQPLEERRSDLLAFEESMNIRSLQQANRAASNRGCQALSTSRCRHSDDFETAKKFASILSAERADAYSTWIKVGWCLYNIDDRLLTSWIEFSKKSSKYKDGECERLWALGMREDALGMGSLSMWAKRDNTEQHADINRHRILSLIVRSCNSDQLTHHDVAVVIHTMYRNTFACASIRSRMWYEFRDHRWRVSDSAYTLRKLISTEVFSEYVSAGAYFQERASLNAREDGEESQADSQKCLDRVKKINSAALKLKCVGFKESLIKELSELFFQENFEEELNSKPHLIGFDNGVYDLDAAIFRDGQPEDYVSFTVGYDFAPYDECNKVIFEIRDFYAKVFRSEALRLYVLRTLAACLHGGVRYERYNVWHGEQGANGKSKLLDLMEQTFGDYSVKFPVSLLTQKRVASNSATSELARSKGRRFASMQEPGENETLNIGVMKELSGNDKIVARHLFHEAIEFRPFYKMFMCCNHLPSVPSQDGGTWRRIRVVEFRSRFCENPDPANQDEFAVDYDIDKKFLAWKPHMMGILLKIFPTVRNGISEPSEVVEYTLNYKRANDCVTEFMDQYVRISTPDSSVTLSALYRQFKLWKKRDSGAGTTGGQSIMPRQEFKSLADKYFGTKTKDRAEAWFGYRLMTEEEEAEEARMAAEQAAAQAALSRMDDASTTVAL